MLEARHLTDTTVLRRRTGPPVRAGRPRRHPPGAARRPLPRRARPAASGAGEDPQPRATSARPTCRWTSRAVWCCAAGWSARACSRSAVDRTLPLRDRQPRPGRPAGGHGVDGAGVPAGRASRPVGRGRAPRLPAARRRRRPAGRGRAGREGPGAVRPPARAAYRPPRAPGSSWRTPIRPRRGPRPRCSTASRACSTSTWPRWAPAARPASRRTTGRCCASAPTGGTTCAAPSAGVRSRRRWPGPTPTRRGRSRTSAETGSRRTCWCCRTGSTTGALDPPSAIAVAGSHLTGQLDLDHLRGRSGLPMPVQAAEVALRRQLGETREGAVRFLGRSAADAVHTWPASRSPATAWEVEVHTRHDDEGARLTCGVDRLSRMPRPRRHPDRSRGRPQRLTQRRTSCEAVAGAAATHDVLGGGAGDQTFLKAIATL